MTNLQLFSIILSVTSFGLALWNVLDMLARNRRKEQEFERRIAKAREMEALA